MSKRYMAGSIPRFLRQTKLGYLPLNCLIGSRVIHGERGNNLVLDVIMLPAPEFQRMKSNIGLEHVLAPSLKMDATFKPGFVIVDKKEVAVPAGEPDPEAYAREYFMKEFGLLSPEPPDGDKNPHES